MFMLSPSSPQLLRTCNNQTSTSHATHATTMMKVMKWAEDSDILDDGASRIWTISTADRLARLSDRLRAECLLAAPNARLRNRKPREAAAVSSSSTTIIIDGAFLTPATTHLAGEIDE